MLIGEVARRAGISTSALRYYEREGLLPPPARAAKRRIYDPRVLGRIRIIQLARSAGFSIAEARIFVGSHTSGGIPSLRWRAMADRKMQEIDAIIAGAMRMKILLRSSFRCTCSTLEDCERVLLAGQRAARSGPLQKARTPRLRLKSPSR